MFPWLSGMHLHSAYLSNYDTWLKDPTTTSPSSQLAYFIIGQDILNAYTSSYFSGITITSGLFHLYRSEGISAQAQLKYACATSLIATVSAAAGSYFHMQVMSVFSSYYNKFQSLSQDHLMLMFGLSSISLSAHQIHMAIPANYQLDSGITDPNVLLQVVPEGLDLQLEQPNLLVQLENVSSVGQFLNPSTRSVFLSQVAAHHKAMASSAILIGLMRTFVQGFQVSILTSWLDYHLVLSTNLALIGSFSIIAAHHLTTIPVYPFISADYTTILCLFIHHAWFSAFLLVGAGAHAAIYKLRSSPTSEIRHRDPVYSHLIWTSIGLGLHSFGLYCHNDTLEALGRPEDIFCDNSIQLKATFAQQFFGGAGLTSTNQLQFKQLLQPDIEVLDKKIIGISQELGTADFIVHHIHAFTIHVTLLILSKGTLYGRNSRFVSDKLALGFTYPCDGPGRGGTCQISPWDHIYLATF